MAIKGSETAEVSVLVDGKSEKAAREQILSEENSYRGHRFDDGDANSWHGYHHGNDVELLSIRQDKTGKALRQSFEVSVDQLVSPDLSWHRFEVDQILETFRWLAISGKDYHQRCTKSEEHTSEIQSLMRISYA